MKKLIINGVIMPIVGMSGCASIVGNSTQIVLVSSHPGGAHFDIKDDTGKVIAQGTTLQSISLEKSTGHYFGGKSYLIIFTEEGYASINFPKKHLANGWYIGGNLAFGGLIGYLLIDPFNGAMYILRPKEAEVTLATVK